MAATITIPIRPRISVSRRNTAIFPGRRCDASASASAAASTRARCVPAFKSREKNSIRPEGRRAHRTSRAAAGGGFVGCDARTRRSGGDPGGLSKDTVVLWPDTFNNHFHPETAIAATELLESAGFTVRVPGEAVCCGRPLYDYGLLPLAKRTLEQTLERVREPIRAGLPIVVLEPSCAA